jgi:hypothetical protein
MAGSFLDARLKPLGHAQAVDITTATLLSALVTIPVAASRVIMQAEGDAIRWTDDGVDPTTTTGMRLENGRDIMYPGDLSTLKFIEEGTSAKINFAFYEGLA